MNEQKTTALDALESIKGIVLTHMEQDVDYDYEENPEYSYHEECDGAIGDNYPSEVALIEKALKALEIIKREPFGFAALSIFAFGDYEEWEKANPNSFTKEEFDLLKEVLL